MGFKESRNMSTEPKVSRMAWWSNPRWRWLAIAAVAFLVCALGYGAYWDRYLRYTAYTDDAYVNGHVVEITPQIYGTVVGINADNTQYVMAGEPLVRLDPADSTVALQRSEAQLAETVRRVRNLFATTAQLEAQVAVRRTGLARAESDYARRARLGRSGAISQENLQHASDAVNAARSALAAAEQQLAANRAWVDGTTIETNPDVKEAAAGVHAAYLSYVRTLLPAPVSGFVAKRDVQLGERVSPGMPLMSVVPLSQVWVDANFKESQLADVRVGQAVTLTSDLYGSGVVFHGRVVGFGAGTGSAFALLPAQNATGNWIKIVQRVAVRIALDPRELAAHPLQIGLSMKAYIDVRDDRGPRLPETASRETSTSTDVFSSADYQAARVVRQIIAENDPVAARAALARGGESGAPPPALQIDVFAGSRFAEALGALSPSDLSTASRLPH
jgi:membrane fusion protein, multidrug efflux system